LVWWSPSSLVQHSSSWLLEQSSMVGTGEGAWWKGGRRPEAPYDEGWRRADAGAAPGPPCSSRGGALQPGDVTLLHTAGEVDAACRDTATPWALSIAVGSATHRRCGLPTPPGWRMRPVSMQRHCEPSAWWLAVVPVCWRHREREEVAELREEREEATERRRCGRRR
jgi:hypothetical protein